MLPGWNLQYISIHALRKESDSRELSRWLLALSFQSTLSVRRATRVRCFRAYGSDISIHALRKESDGLVMLLCFADIISIHALRKESDIPVGTYWREVYISIHALRKESDVRSVDIH